MDSDVVIQDFRPMAFVSSMERRQMSQVWPPLKTKTTRRKAQTANGDVADHDIDIGEQVEVGTYDMHTC